ncbi:MAG: universal stress protein [Cellvibrionaceae bacterium]
MKRYKSVLCALDLTDNSRLIIDVARSFQPSVIRLLHVCEHPITGFGESTGQNLRVTETQIRQQVFPRLNELAQAHEIDRENTEILFGSPAEVIHTAAKNHHSDLIIIGSQCRAGLKRLLGSITSDIIHGAPCDILTVRI